VIFESRVDTPGGDWASPYALLAQRGYTCFAAEARVEHPPVIEISLYPTTAANRSDFPVHLTMYWLSRSRVHSKRHASECRRQQSAM
jgi:hypothetical protein